MEGNRKKFFSIIVPIYNVESYLPKCIQSVLNQTFEDYELILVDDGSTDRSKYICDNFVTRDPRLQVINKKNGGLVSARKAGISRATGQYVLNLDGDDYLMPTLLEGLANIITTYWPDMVAFECIQKFVDGKENVSGNGVEEGLYTGEKLDFLKEKLLCDRDKKGMNFGGVLPSICLKAVRREILFPNQMLVPENITNGEDTAVTIPTICECKSVFVSEINGYCYVQRPSSMIKTFREEEISKYKELREYLENRSLVIPHENIDSYFFNLIVNYLSQAASSYRRYRDFKRCIERHILPNMGDVIIQCEMWSMDYKTRIRFMLIQHRCWFALWCYYKHKTKFEQSVRQAKDQ